MKNHKNYRWFFSSVLDEQVLTAESNVFYPNKTDSVINEISSRLYKTMSLLNDYFNWITSNKQNRKPLVFNYIKKKSSNNDLRSV